MRSASGNLQGKRPPRRYLIAEAAGGPIGDVAAELERDPEVEVVDLQGPAGLPDTIVATMADDRAQALREGSGGRLIVEQDSPLEPSD